MTMLRKDDEAKHKLVSSMTSTAGNESRTNVTRYVRASPSERSDGRPQCFVVPRNGITDQLTKIRMMNNQPVLTTAVDDGEATGLTAPLTLVR